MALAIFFIDANVWLDFYESGRSEHQKLLPELSKMGEDLFVTEQVHLEVQRNKLRCAQEAMKRAENGIAEAAKIIQSVEHLLPIQLNTRGDSSQLSEGMRESRTTLKNMRKQVSSFSASTLEAVGTSSDPISMALDEIFEKPRAPSKHELEQARIRREMGIPPGKKGDPLGDQVSWEQLVGLYTGTEVIWIVTRDADYFVRSRNRPILNPVLLSDLKAKVKGGGQPEVHIFENLGEALKSYAEAAPEIRKRLQERMERINMQRLRNEAARAEAERLRREQMITMGAVLAGTLAAGSALVLGGAALAALTAQGSDNKSTKLTLGGPTSVPATPPNEEEGTSEEMEWPPEDDE